MHDVAVLNNVFFAFDTHFAGFFYSCFTTKSDIIVIFDYFGTNETFFKVGVDYTRALWCFRATHECPSTHFIFTGCEICLKIKQSISSTDKTCHSRFFKTYFFKKFLTFFECIEFGDFTFCLSSYNHQLGIFVLNSLAHSFHIFVSTDSRCVIDIAYIKHRLVGEQEKIVGKTLFVFSLKFYRTSRLALLQCFLISQKHISLKTSCLVATCLCCFKSSRQACLYSLKVLKLKFIIYNLFIANRIYRTTDVSDIVIVKTTKHMKNCISLTNICKKLIA